MATAGSFTQVQNFYSDLVLAQVEGGDQGYPKLEKTIKKTGTLKLGSIVNEAGAEIAAADAETAYGVVVWCNVDIASLPDQSDVVVVLAVRGATLNRKLVTFTDAVVNDAGVSALETRGLKVTNHVYP